MIKSNEVSHNDTCNCYPATGGASKLVGTTNDSVIGNYIHDNGGNGIWFDTNNTGVLIEGNTVSVNMRYGKAVSMEQNTGTAIIRNNTITVGSGGEVAILIANSSNVQISNNRVSTASASSGGAIQLFFDASRSGYDTVSNRVTNNTITLRRSATITASVWCDNVSNCSPYWTTNGNVFRGTPTAWPAGRTRTGPSAHPWTGPHGRRSASTRRVTSSRRDGHVSRRPAVTRRTARLIFGLTELTGGDVQRAPVASCREASDCG